MLSLYVYFKVTPANALIARNGVSALLEDAKQLGIATEFWRRQADAFDGTQTWMTVFHAVDGDFEAQLSQLALQHGLTESAGPLSVERFVRC